MKATHSILAVVLAAASAWAGPFDKAELRGTTDKDPVSYKANEKIVFTLALTGAEVPAGYFVSWTLRGDYISPPSGIAAAYNNLTCPKSFNWTQGSDHGYIPPKPVIQTIQGGK